MGLPFWGIRHEKMTSALVAARLGAGRGSPLAAQDLTITNAHIVVGNGTVIERGSIVVRGGKIESVTAGAPARSQGPSDRRARHERDGRLHRRAPSRQHGARGEGANAAPARGRLHDDPLGRRPGDGNLTLREHIESGQINGPRVIPSERLRLAGLTPETAREAVRSMKAAGIDYTGEISLTPVPGPTEQELEVLRAVLDEGKKSASTFKCTP